MKITIRIPPKPQKRDRIGTINGKGRSFKDSKQKKYEQVMNILLSEHRPARPSEHPILLGVKVYLPIPVSKPNWWKQGAVLNVIKPVSHGAGDLSNLIKNIEDIMQGVFFKDDCQIIGYLESGKYYSDDPRWEIELVEKPQPTTKQEYMDRIDITEFDKTYSSRQACVNA
jgi:Holliday junction resolvase RusA-like endonuclease